MYIIPDANMSGLITAIMAQLGTAATGIIDIHLYTNDLVPTKTNVLADFTELTNVEVPGYSKKTVNWFAGTPYREQNGGWVDPNSLADPAFVATADPPAPQVVYGFFATDTTDAVLLGSGRFTSPFTFTKSGDGFRLADDPVLLQDTGGTVQILLPDLEPL